ESEHPEKRGGSGLKRGGAQMPFDVVFDLSRRAPHVEGERRDRNPGCDGQYAFPERLIGRASKKEGGANAYRHGQRNAPAYRRDKLATAPLLQVRNADSNNQEGLETFAQSDDKRLNHGDH